MREFLLLIVLLTAFFPCWSQVGIGTANPKAQLDIVASSAENPSEIDGLLIPRLEKFPAVNPSEEQHAMLVFLNKEYQNQKSGFYYWNTNVKKWETIIGDATGNFYKPGTSVSPLNIQDPMFRTGNIGIGTQEITSKLQIAINSTADAAIKKGLEVDNNNPATDNLTTYGIISDNRSATNGNKYGIKNNVGGIGSGIHYGIFNETYQNSGTNDIYGFFNRVGRTFGARSNNFGIYSEIGTVAGQGNIYGIYCTALGDHNANVFAGYFAGRVGIGSSPQEEYIFPARRGNQGQSLTLDSSGNMNWTYPTNQNYSTTASATGDFVITEDISTLRINDNVSRIVIPAANANKGRIITLVGWKGTKEKPFIFINNSDDIYDVVNDTSIGSISGSQMLTIQSAGNRWILLNMRKAP